MMPNTQKGLEGKRKKKDDHREWEQQQFKLQRTALQDAQLPRPTFSFA